MAGSEKSKQLSFDLAKLFTRYKKTVFRHVAIRICLCAIRRHTALHFTGTLFFLAFPLSYTWTRGHHRGKGLVRNVDVFLDRTQTIWCILHWVTLKCKYGVFFTIMYQSNRSFNIPPPGHTPGIWRLFLPGRERIWSPPIGGGEFDL